MPEHTVDTPLGPLTLVENDGAIVKIDWGRTRTEVHSTLLNTAASEITRYFTGDLKSFSIPVNPTGTKFQNRVWQQMHEIPYGHVLTYGAIAQSLSSSPRAIGGACGRNPIPIIIPCHRIIGAKGKLTGYTGLGGTKTKLFLLDLENNLASCH